MKLKPKKRYIITGSPDIFPGEELNIKTDLYTEDGKIVVENTTDLFMAREVSETQAQEWQKKPSEEKLSPDTAKKFVENLKQIRPTENRDEFVEILKKYGVSDKDAARLKELV